MISPPPRMTARLPNSMRRTSTRSGTKAMRSMATVSTMPGRYFTSVGAPTSGARLCPSRMTSAKAMNPRPTWTSVAWNITSRSACGCVIRYVPTPSVEN